VIHEITYSLNRRLWSFNAAGDLFRFKPPAIGEFTPELNGLPGDSGLILIGEVCDIGDISLLAGVNMSDILEPGKKTYNFSFFILASSTYYTWCPCRLLGTRFTNVISCFEPGSQEPYRDIFFETPCVVFAGLSEVSDHSLAPCRA
jgi:hypothetical protein